MAVTRSGYLRQWRGGARPCQPCETVSLAVRMATVRATTAIASLGSAKPIADGVMNWPLCIAVWQIGHVAGSSFDGIFFAGADLPCVVLTAGVKLSDDRPNACDAAKWIWVWVM